MDYRYGVNFDAKKSMEPENMNKENRWQYCVVPWQQKLIFVVKRWWLLGSTGWCFSCKATVCLPLLPGGATILCHFWNKVVFKQSRGDNAYALCLDINSCIGSKITHNCKKKREKLYASVYNWILKQLLTKLI